MNRPDPSIDAGADAPAAVVDPLAQIRAEHDRQYELCDLLERAAGDPNLLRERAFLQQALTFLRDELGVHNADEEVDLFPRLRARCLPSDGMDAILSQLSREHALDREVVGYLIEDLQASLDGRFSHSMRLAINLANFSVTHRRHIAWENSVVAPLAEKRLTDEDKTAIASAMTMRRARRH